MNPLHRWLNNRRADQIYENPRAAKPTPVNRTWRQRLYWAEVRRNMIVAVMVTVVLLGGAIWLYRPTTRTPVLAAQHQGHGLNLR